MNNKEYEALCLAVRAHDGQYDKGGSPYILHPLAVMNLLSNENERILALLHDTVEDTDVTNEEVREGFGDVIADALDCLTHRKNETYEEYIDRVASNPLSVDVKLADLRHNMDLSRIPDPTEKDWERIRKYKRVREKLARYKKAI